MGQSDTTHNPVPPQTVRDGEGEGGPSSGQDGDNLCWDFTLQDCTEAVEDVEVGTPVQGTVASERVLIFADFGVLGFAPRSEAVKILDAIEGADASMPMLAGSVLDDSNPPRVRVCIV